MRWGAKPLICFCLVQCSEESKTISDRNETEYFGAGNQTVYTLIFSEQICPGTGELRGKSELRFVEESPATPVII